MAGPVSLLDVLQRFAATMVHSYEMNDMLYELGESAVSILGAAGAGVSVVADDGSLRFVTATSESVVAFEQAQEQQQQGPCVEAFRTGQIVPVADLAEEERWPEYRRAAIGDGFVAVVGIPLWANSHRLGSLDVYDTQRREWTEQDVVSAKVLADIATGYIVRAGELAEARRLSEQLQQALESRVVIEQAKGMVARDHQVTVDQAFDMMRLHSRANNVPLRAVASAVVELGLQIPSRQR